MAIGVGSVSNTPVLGSRTNSTITAPSGITNGDLLVAVLHVGNAALSAITVTPPAGFAEVTNSPVAASKSDPYTIATHVFYKVASGESGNYTFTHTTADTEGYMYRLTGCDTGTSIDATPVTTFGNGIDDGETTTYLSITTVTDGAFLIYAESDWNGVGSGTISGTTPTITARRAGSISLVSDGTLATHGATGSRTRVNGNTGAATAPWTSIVVPIRPYTSAPFTGAKAIHLKDSWS